MLEDNSDSDDSEKVLAVASGDTSEVLAEVVSVAEGCTVTIEVEVISSVVSDSVFVTVMKRIDRVSVDGAS